MRGFRQKMGLTLAASILCVLPSHATPIKLDLKKLLAQPQPKKLDYVPARAGWDGPEQRPPESNVYLQRYAPAASSHALRASLLAAAVPDWRAVLGLIALILFLRKTRKASSDEVPPSQQEPPANIPRAA